MGPSQSTLSQSTLDPHRFIRIHHDGLPQIDHAAIKQMPGGKKAKQTVMCATQRLRDYLRKRQPHLNNLSSIDVGPSKALKATTTEWCGQNLGYDGNVTEEDLRKGKVEFIPHTE